ncbi:MAG: hypothetical protein J3Q66DRAFT_406198 [Benniella sp.]|nr:MAG: hypothetical protein J3Q66DRAFT_406198 [Benniella sp.]
MCEVYAPAWSGVDEIHIVIDVADDGRAFARDPFNRQGATATTVNGLVLQPNVWVELEPGDG